MCSARTAARWNRWRAQAEASRFQLDATYLTLTANVVTAAIQEAGLRAQIAAPSACIALERESLAVLRRQLELGAIAEADVFAQDAALAQLEGTLAAAEQATASDARLARRPSRGICPPISSAALRAGTVDACPPICRWACRRNWSSGAPTSGPRRRSCTRPPRRSASRSPTCCRRSSSRANLGSTATADGRSVQAGHRILERRGRADADLVRGRDALHRKRAADAALDQAAAQYRSAVLTAFQNVADALHALDARCGRV